MQSRCRSKSVINKGLTRAGLFRHAIVAACAVGAAAIPARAVTPQSPEVQKLVEAGLAAIEKPATGGDSYGDRMGAKCLVGMAFIKAGKRQHPRVAEAIEAVRASMAPDARVDVYSNGLAIAFLCELGPTRFRREVNYYLDMLTKRQKAEGGWGYDANSQEGYTMATGDTSQTQYASLGYWCAYRHGFKIPPESLERLTHWLLRTQDPSGVWGYQGNVAPSSTRVAQSESSCSMLSAGLGSVLICADLLAIQPSGFGDNAWADEEFQLEELPPALREARAAAAANEPTPIRIKSDRVRPAEVLEAVELARNWMSKNYEIDIHRYNLYYLYATERYQSFYELLTDTSEAEPQWYNDGYEWLAKTQLKEGGWSADCGRTVDTAFAVLFLLRSTQQSIQATLGEGTLVGGRGLPANVASATLRGNKVIANQMQTKVGEMLAMVDDADQSRLDELARDPRALLVGEIDATSARRLEQLVRGGEPPVRLLAVRALGRTGNLDYVPTLIYALTDPDRDVVLEARDSLGFVSRRFDGFGPPDAFTERERFDSIEAWKKWYQSLRPDSLPLQIGRN